MGIIEFLKIKFFSGKKVLNSLTSVNERLEYAKDQLYKKKDVLEKIGTNIHKNCITLEDKIETAKNNSAQALAHAEEFLKQGKEAEAKQLFRQHTIADRAAKRYTEALEKAKANKEKIDESISNYDATIADVMAQISDLKTDMEISELNDIATDDGIPTEIAKFLSKVEAEIKDKTYEQQAKSEVKALTRVSTLKMDFSHAASDAEFEKFKQSVHRR